MDKVQHVFVYGTLKKGHGNHDLLRNAKFIGTAKTLSDHYTMVDGGFPWVITKGHFFVKGELYEVTDEDTMRQLDRLEGVPSLFNRHYTNVKTEDNEVYDVVMYVASTQNEQYVMSSRKHIVPNDNNECEWRA